MLFYFLLVSQDALECWPPITTRHEPPYVHSEKYLFLWSFKFYIYYKKIDSKYKGFVILISVQRVLQVFISQSNIVRHLDLKFL